MPEASLLKAPQWPNAELWIQYQYDRIFYSQPCFTRITGTTSSCPYDRRSRHLTYNIGYTYVKLDSGSPISTSSFGKKLSLSSFAWNQLTHDAQNNLLELLAPFKELELLQLGFIAHSEVFRLVSCAPSLTALFLRRGRGCCSQSCWVKLTAFARPNFGNPCISFTGHNKLVLPSNGIKSSGLHREGRGGWRAIPVFMITRTLGPTLENLELRYTNVRQNSDHDHVVDCSLHTHLEHLTLTVERPSFGFIKDRKFPGPSPISIPTLVPLKTVTFAFVGFHPSNINLANIYGYFARSNPVFLPNQTKLVVRLTNRTLLDVSDVSALFRENVITLAGYDKVSLEVRCYIFSSHYR